MEQQGWDRNLLDPRQVVEGVPAARAVRQVAQKLGVEMPIAEQVYRVLYEDEPAEKAVYTLMTRQLRSEI